MVVLIPDAERPTANRAMQVLASTTPLGCEPRMKVRPHDGLPTSEGRA